MANLACNLLVKLFIKDAISQMRYHRVIGYGLMQKRRIQILDHTFVSKSIFVLF